MESRTGKGKLRAEEKEKDRWRRQGYESKTLTCLLSLMFVCIVHGLPTTIRCRCCWRCLFSLECFYPSIDATSDWVCVRLFLFPIFPNVESCSSVCQRNSTLDNSPQRITQFRECVQYTSPDGPILQLDNMILECT